MVEGTFATAINCMDGRTQLPIIEYLKEKFGVDYVDAVTEPGPIKYLAEKQDKQIVESIKSRVGISVNAHGSKTVCVVGHHDCAGNPVDKLEQIEQLKLAEETIKAWGFDINIIKVYVDENWQVIEI